MPQTDSCLGDSPGWSPTFEIRKKVKDKKKKQCMRSAAVFIPWFCMILLSYLAVTSSAFGYRNVLENNPQATFCTICYVQSWKGRGREEEAAL